MMDIGFLVCSYLTADFLNKDKVLDTIDKGFNGKYSKLNAFDSNPNAQQNSIQLLFNVQDFTNPGFILNIFSNKIDIVYDPNKDVSALDKNDFEKALSVLDAFFGKLNLKPNRLSFMAIARQEVSDKEAENIINKVSKIAKNSVVEFYYKDVSRIDNNNIITVIQVNDVAQTNTNNQKTQDPKSFVISVESNNTPENENLLEQDMVDSLTDKLTSALIDSLNTHLFILNKKL
jgi:hypothetical protein